MISPAWIKRTSIRTEDDYSRFVHNQSLGLFLQTPMVGILTLDYSYLLPHRYHIYLGREGGGGQFAPWSRIVELVSSQDLHSWLPDYSGDSWAFIDDFLASFAVLSNPYVVYINGLLNISFSSIAHSVRLCVTQTLYNSTVVWTHRMQQGGPRHTFLSLVSLSYG